MTTIDAMALSEWLREKGFTGGEIWFTCNHGEIPKVIHEIKNSQGVVIWQQELGSPVELWKIMQEERNEKMETPYPERRVNLDALHWLRNRINEIQGDHEGITLVILSEGDRHAIEFSTDTDNKVVIPPEFPKKSFTVLDAYLCYAIILALLGGDTQQAIQDFFLTYAKLGKARRGAVTRGERDALTKRMGEGVDAFEKDLPTVLSLLRTINAWLEIVDANSTDVEEPVNA